MHLLLLGATGFLSTAVLEAAVAAGHEVTALTRGRRPTPDHAGVTWLRADRDDVDDLRAALGALQRHRDLPDAVIDTCGYAVTGARAAAEVLGGVARYAYVSSISAYSGWPPGPVRSEADPTWGPLVDQSVYGPMKAESERVLGAALGDRLLVARAGLIVGPGDRTCRLTGWLHRIATAERVAVPADLDQPIAVVDARDLAGWLVEGVGRGWHGPVTATGPVGMATFGGLLEACRTAVAATGGTPATLVPVPDDVLLEHGVRPWSDLPFWLPAETARTAWDVDTTRARALGLPSRPVADSVADTWAWQQDAGLEHVVPPRVAAVADAVR